MTNEPVPVTAAGGVLYKTESSTKKVLLMKRNGVWDLPKGKLEIEEGIEECALREVEEETGAGKLTIEKFLCDTYHEYQRGGLKYGKSTHWYLMKTGEPDFEFRPQVEEGITELQWVELSKAKSMVHFENLVTVLDSIGGT